MRARTTTIAGLVALILSGGVAHAGIQVAGDSAKPPEPIESVALLPRDVRALVLEAGAHPELVDSLAGLQTRTNEEMLALTSALAAHERRMAWLVLAHPHLVSAMAAAASEPRALLDLLAAHADDVSGAARALLRERPGLVREMAALQSRATADFEQMLAHHPLGTQALFRRLLDDPRALGLVMSEQALLRSLGALHRHDPRATEVALDELAEEALATHAAALPGFNPTPAPIRDGVPETLAANAAEPEPSAGHAHETRTTADAPPSVAVWLGGCPSRTVASHRTTATNRIAVAPPPRRLTTAGTTLPVNLLPKRSSGGVVVWPRPEDANKGSTSYLYKRRSPPVTLLGLRSEGHRIVRTADSARADRNIVFSRHGWGKGARLVTTGSRRVALESRRATPTPRARPSRRVGQQCR